MDITKKDVELCGKLARMKMTAEETVIYEQQLKDLFNWVRELSVLNTDGIEIADTSVTAHLRQDIPVVDEALNQTLIHAFNDKEGRGAKVKKVL